MDVNGIERVRELPKHNTANAIFTKPDGTKSENKDQTFIATKMVVADANGVLGYTDWNSNHTPDVKKRVTIGYWAGLWDGNLYALGGTGFPTFNSQLKSMINYGPAGIYNKVGGIDFQQYQTEELDNFTGAQLKMVVDVFCVGVQVGVDLDPSLVTKIKDFADLGGVVIVLFDSGRNTPAFQIFGGNGNVGTGGLTSYSIAGKVGSSGVFGTVAGGTAINGAQTTGRVLNSQLASGSEILAREGGANSSQAGIWTTGPNGRIIFFWDEGVFRNTSISTTIINTEQEKYLHNIMAYAFDKLSL
ncbi:hypothetical protein J2799_000176 [Chryseobacterium vietnamense]|uniref:hypothetical protein n=1 Tax=Chryseobacterium vietnamense TaxID=866785 RepID=UPI00285F782A|nr:hypothetical protein [Chryseobacterium vietnamense]MDR6485691.1 hypothetical protein [Chryseobacterium vietnamense]